MGFLKFLKRGKRESLDELDLPPAPPPLEGFEESMPELPEIPDFEEKISAPEPEMKMPEFDLPEEKPETEEMPQFPDFPKMEEKAFPSIPTITAPETPEPMPSMPQAPQQIPEPPIPEEKPEQEESEISPVRPRISGGLFHHERRREIPKTIYVKVDNFKATLGSINIVRSDLRKSEEALAKLEAIKSSKDKSFDRLRASLDDLQKKLIFIDKTLFKGE